MLTDFEREECRNYVNRQEQAEHTPQFIMDMARQYSKGQERSKQILGLYGGQVEPQVLPKQESPINPILTNYM